MRFFELLSVVFPDLTSTEVCGDSALRLERSVNEQAHLLARYGCLTAGARDEMIASLRQELTWLARLGSECVPLEEVAQRWSVAQDDMLRRFERDRAALELHLCAGRSIGQISSVVLDLSDRHEGAHSVALLTFSSGEKIVYKPRSVETERCFFLLLSGLNQLSPPHRFAALKIWDRGSYGWVEFADHRPCSDDQELRAYYRNAGALLCLLRLLRTSDCHFQNLIACGEQPVLVDAETLFQPRTAGAGRFTVADTNMLPSMGDPSDLGALSCVTPRQVSLRVDGVITQPVTLIPRESIPFPEGMEPSPHLFADEMAEGFSETGKFLASEREQVAALVKSVGAPTVRILPRGTQEYYEQMLQMALGREAGADLSLQESDALRRFEVPRFEAKADIEAVLQEIADLDDRELTNQLKMMRLLWVIYGSMRSMCIESR